MSLVVILEGLILTSKLTFSKSENHQACNLIFVKFFLLVDKSRLSNWFSFNKIRTHIYYIQTTMIQKDISTILSLNQVHRVKSWVVFNFVKSMSGVSLFSSMTLKWASVIEALSIFNKNFLWMVYHYQRRLQTDLD
jgi:hypothetical protein